MRAEEDLSLAGAVRRAAGKGALPRPGQAELSEAFALAASDGHDLVATAPVGTGKSLAYLVTAVRSAAHLGRDGRVLVSVSSKALQEQVSTKDFPAAAGVSGVSVAVLKGRTSYVCNLKAERGGLSKAASRWLTSSEDGDLTGASEKVAAELRPNLTTCRWTKCPLFSQCFGAAARTAAGNADVVVTNHALLASQATSPVASVLGSSTIGPFRSVVLDEAHSMPEWIRSIGAIRFDERMMASLAEATGTIVKDRPRNLEEVAAIAAEMEEVSGAGAFLSAARNILSPPYGWGWWTDDDGVLVAAPVMTAPVLRRLWDIQEHRPRVMATSGTLPNWRDLGLDSPEQVSIPSPFEAAYARSVLYVPAQTEAARAALSSQWGRFDSRRHMAWAMDDITEIATRTALGGGGTLVLTSTTSGARAAAGALKESGLEVITQWDRGAVASWRRRTTSVLVGTRSLMTGLDAPGDTCRSVIIDRVPRAAGNHADDMRVRALTSTTKLDEAVARDLVYAGDAAMLLEQASGRLIRSADDWGLLAVLDPRLAPGPWSYKGLAAGRYREALAAFGAPVHDLEAALGMLEAGR